MWRGVRYGVEFIALDSGPGVCVWCPPPFKPAPYLVHILGHHRRTTAGRARAGCPRRLALREVSCVRRRLSVRGPARPRGLVSDLQKESLSGHKFDQYKTTQFLLCALPIKLP